MSVTAMSRYLQALPGGNLPEVKWARLPLSSHGRFSSRAVVLPDFETLSRDLLIASFKGSTNDVLNILDQAGYDAELLGKLLLTQDITKRNPLRNAILLENKESAVALAKAMVKVGHILGRQAEFGEAALLETRDSSTVSIALIEELAKVQGNLDGQDQYGRTRLAWAALKGQYEVAKALAKAHANLNLPNKDGKAPIYSAYSNGHSHIAKLLLAYGAQNIDVESKEGQELLEEAQEKCGRFISSALIRPMVAGEVNHRKLSNMNKEQERLAWFDEVVKLIQHGLSLPEKIFYRAMYTFNLA